MSEMNQKTIQYEYAAINRILGSVDIDLDDIYTLDRVYIVPKEDVYSADRDYKKQADAAENDGLFKNLETKAHSLAMVSEIDSEGKEFTGADRAGMLMDALNKGGKIYVCEPGETRPRRLTVEASGPVLSDRIRKPATVKEPDVAQPKRPGIFARFANWITRGAAFKDTFEKYDRDLQAYSDAQEKYAADLQKYSKDLAAHQEAVLEIAGLSQYRDHAKEAAYAREMRAKRSTEISVDQLAGKQPEQIDMSRTEKTAKTLDLTSSKK